MPSICCLATGAKLSAQERLALQNKIRRKDVDTSDAKNARSFQQKKVETHRAPDKSMKCGTKALFPGRRWLARQAAARDEASFAQTELPARRISLNTPALPIRKLRKSATPARVDRSASQKNSLRR